MTILLLLLLVAALTVAAAWGYREGYDEAWLDCEAYHCFEEGEENADFNNI